MLLVVVMVLVKKDIPVVLINLVEMVVLGVVALVEDLLLVLEVRPTLRLIVEQLFMVMLVAVE